MKIARTRRAGSAKRNVRGATAADFDARSFLESVKVGRRSIEYRSKEFIFRQGDPADAVFYIEKGEVRITVVSEYGRKGIIARLRAGEFFGEGCLAGQDFHLASADAIGPTAVVCIDKATMVRVLHEQPALSERFLSFLLSRNIQIEADLIAQLFNSNERRLARVLMLLANFGKEGKLEKVIPKISSEVLAAQVGTTTARIEFFMSKFKKLGFVEYGDGSKANGGDTLKVHTSLLNVIVHD